MGDEVLFVRSKKITDDGNSSEEESDAWDDTALIEAYDSAVSLAKEEVRRRMCISNMDVTPTSPPVESQDCNKGGGKSKSKKGKWAVGDTCRCVFSEDGLSYEACIIQLEPSNGTCIVKYVGYDNEELVKIKSLQHSHGHAARLRQAEEAGNVPQVEVVCNTNEEKKCFEVGSAENLKEQPIPQRTYKRHLKSPQNHMDWSSQGPFVNTRRGRQRCDTTSSHSSQHFPMGPPQMMFPPPPPIHLMSSSNMINEGDESEALSSMLMSWYMSGFHTGYYQGVKQKAQSRNSCCKCNCRNKH